MRLFHLKQSQEHLTVVEDAISKSVGYSVSSGKFELKRTNLQIKFWGNYEKVLAWAIKINWLPREDIEYT